MKKIALMLIAISYSVSAITVTEILDKMEANENSKTSIATMTQNVHQSSGKIVTSKLKSFSQKEGEESIMEYIYPKRIKGMKILSLSDGDEIWMFSPRTKRVRKIAGSSRKNGVNGSDFSYDDMSGSGYDEDYTTKLLKDVEYNSKSCYLVEGVKKSDDTPYSKVMITVDKTSFMPFKVEMFDEDGELWKILTMDGIKKVGKYYSADKIIMSNVQKETKTEMISESIEFDIDVNPSMFSQKYLKR